MSNALVFYTNPMSRGRIVRWMLEEICQPYSTEIMEYGTTMKSPTYLAINPMGKVPALRFFRINVRGSTKAALGMEFQNSRL
jgi:glutathione S-transferase